MVQADKQVIKMIKAGRFFIVINLGQPTIEDEDGEPDPAFLRES